MIVTVTLNPAIDKTIEIDSLKCGGLNRIKRSIYDAGGKGINVSKTIKALGGESVAIGFLAGTAGKTFLSLLEGYDITCDFIWIDGETRTNTKVFEASGRLTELNESGPVISDEQIQKLMEKLDQYASEETMFIFSGSIPAGVDKGLYREMIKTVHKKGAIVLLDADGEAFRLAVSEAPEIVKPNIDELKHFVEEVQTSGQMICENERAEVTEQVLIEKGISLLAKKGIKTLILSKGGDGASFYQLCEENTVLDYPALPVKIHSTVGAGDSMAAAWAYGWAQKCSFEEKAKLAMAVSAGAVMTEGTKPPTAETVHNLLDKNSVY